MRLKEEIKLEGMDNVSVNNGTRLTVTSSVGIAHLDGEESGVMSLLDHNEGKGRLVVLVERGTGSTDGSDFRVHDLLELTLRDTITVKEDSFGLLTTSLVKVLEDLLDHVGKISNDLSAVSLDTDR